MNLITVNSALLGSTAALNAMRMKTVLCCIAILLVPRFAVVARPIPQEGPPSRHVEGELLVKFAGGPRGLAAERARSRMNHEVKRHFDFIGWQHIRLPRGMAVEQGVALYRNLPGVIAVEPNDIIEVFSPPLPDDPTFPQQWGLARIGASNAWAVTTGSTDVVVAVIDTGVNYAHEDLSANMWRNPAEVQGNGIDDDGNGYVDDVYGIDPAGNDTDPMDPGVFLQGILVYHGTAVASIIGAVGNNGRGIAGLNWTIQIMAIRTVGTSGSATADILQGLNYIVLMKRRGVNIRVTNMSWGGMSSSFGSSFQALRDASDAISREGIVQVAGPGNSGQNVDLAPIYPASFDVPGMLAVAASDESDGLAAFLGGGSSNFGPTNVDLAAPGTAILTCWGPGTNSYLPTFNGTSAATPHVAGAAALLFAANSNATAADVKAALLETVDVLPAFTNKMVSNGRLNVGRAIQHPAVAPGSPPFIASAPQTQTLNEGTNILFKVTAYGARPLGYQWWKESQVFADQTNATLVLSNLAPTHAGDYSVVVSNAFGMATSAVATLTVRTVPRLVGPLMPLQFGVVTGEVVTLSVETTGTLPIGYRWRHIRTNGTAANLTNYVLNEHTCFHTFTVGTNSAGAYTLVLTNAAQPTSSLQRTNTVLTLGADSDGDGLPDPWETAYPAAANPTEDTDHDGLTNLQEYRASTDPLDSNSYLRIENIALAGASNAVSLRFFAVANKTYTVQHRLAAEAGEWSGLADVLASPTNRLVEIIDSNGPPADAHRLYRLATPRVP